MVGLDIYPTLLLSPNSAAECQSLAMIFKQCEYRSLSFRPHSTPGHLRARQRRQRRYRDDPAMHSNHSHPSYLSSTHPTPSPCVTRHTVPHPHPHSNRPISQTTQTHILLYHPSLPIFPPFIHVAPSPQHLSQLKLAPFRELASVRSRRALILMKPPASWGGGDGDMC